MTDPNRALLARAAARLAPLRHDLALAGACITGLLVTDAAASPIRPTTIVDVIADVTSYAEYVQLCEQLTANGFAPGDASPGRWMAADVTLDLLPTDEALLVFANPWLAPAFAAAVDTEIAGWPMRVIRAPHLLAIKLWAFRHRRRAPADSPDLEDIVALVDGRASLVDEVASAAPDLRAFVTETMSAWIGRRAFIESVALHLPGDSASQARRPLVEARLRALARLAADPSARA